MNVLVIDDSAVNRAILERALTLEGHTVVTAKDGLEALHHLTTDSTIEFAICDLIMPQIDGCEVYRRYDDYYESKGKGKKVPFVLLTGAQDIGRLKDAKGLGFVDIMSKPPNYARLYEHLQNAHLNLSKNATANPLKSYMDTIDEVAKSLIEAKDQEGAAYLLERMETVGLMLGRLIN